MYGEPSRKLAERFRSPSNRGALRANLQRARDREAENTRLKKLLAEAHLDIEALKVA